MGVKNSREGRGFARPPSAGRPIPSETSAGLAFTGFRLQLCMSFSRCRAVGGTRPGGRVVGVGKCEGPQSWKLHFARSTPSGREPRLPAELVIGILEVVI